MFKNVASQKVTLFVFDYSTGAPKTGDAANLTFYVQKDDGTVTALTDTSASEVDSTNAKGSYTCDLTQSETNGDKLLFTGKSSTSNVAVVPLLVYTTPPNFSTFSVDSNGRIDVIKLAGTTQTARDIGASVLISSGTGSGQLNVTSGVVQADMAAISADATAADNLETMLDGTGGKTLTATFAGAVTSVTNTVTAKLGDTAHGGVNATLTLERVEIATASSNPAVSIINSADAPALQIAQSGSAQAVFISADGSYALDIQTNIASGSALRAANTAGDCVVVETNASRGAIDANIEGTLTTVTTATGVTNNVNAVLANTAHGGTSATLRLGASSSTPALFITNSAGDAVRYQSTGSNGNAIDLISHGSGAVVDLTSGATGRGLSIVANTAAVYLEASGSSESAMILSQDGNGDGSGVIQGILNEVAGTVIDAVWDEPLSGHTTSGTAGKALSSASSAGDPWSTAVPGSYTSGQAGYILGNNLNAQVSAVKAKTDNLPSDPADASDIAASFSSLASTLATIAAYIDTEVAAIKAKTDNLPASPAAVGSAMTLEAGAIADTTFASGAITDAAFAANSITSTILASSAATEIANAVWASVAETGVTTLKALQAIAAMLAGVITTAGQASEVFKAIGNPSTTRVTVTPDASGNRSAVTVA